MISKEARRRLKGEPLHELIGLLVANESVGDKILEERGEGYEAIVDMRKAIIQELGDRRYSYKFQGALDAARSESLL